MNTGVSGVGSSSSMAAAKRALTAWYAAQSSRAELRPHVDQMAERPQAFVGEPAVVRGELSARRATAAAAA